MSDDMLEAEFGSSYLVGQKISGTLYDHEGRKIEMPMCKDCNTAMCCIIGESTVQWVCQGGCA